MADQKPNLAEIARKKRHLHLIEKMHSGKALTKPEITELEQFEAEPLAPTVVKTMEEVARVMGVSYRTVQRWKQDGMPTTQDGFYDLDQIKEWHAARSDKDEIQESKEYWEERISSYKASLLELDVKKATGELISKEEVEKGRIDRIIAVKRTFLALPTTLAPALSMREPREVEAILYEAITEIIDEFSGVINEEPNTGQDNLDTSGTPSVEASGEDNSQPMG